MAQAHNPSLGRNKACARYLAEHLSPGGPVGGETTGEQAKLESFYRMGWLAGRASVGVAVRDRKRPRQVVDADEATGEPAT